MIRHFDNAISESDLIPMDREPEPQPLTHIVPGHAINLGRGPFNRPQFRALCNELVEDFHHVASNPTCPECARIDAEDAQTYLALQEELATPLPNPVKSTWANPLAGYRPKGAKR